MYTKDEKLAILVQAIELSANAISAFRASYPEHLSIERTKKLGAEDVNPAQRAALASALADLSVITTHCEAMLRKPLHLDEESLINDFPEKSGLLYNEKIRMFAMPLYQLAIRLVDLHCRSYHSKMCEFSSAIDTGVEKSMNELQDFAVDRLAFKLLRVERDRLASCVSSLQHLGFGNSKLAAAPEIQREVIAVVLQKIRAMKLSKRDESSFMSDAQRRAKAAAFSHIPDPDDFDVLLSLKLACLGAPQSESAQKLDRARAWLKNAAFNFSNFSVEFNDETTEFLDGEDAADELLGDEATWKYLKLHSRTTLGDYVERFESIVKPLITFSPNLIDTEDRETYIELCHVVTGGHWRAAYALSRAFLERLLKKHHGWDDRVDSKGHGKPLMTQLHLIKNIDGTVNKMFPDLKLIVDGGNDAMHDDLNNRGRTKIFASTHLWSLQTNVISLLKLAQHIGAKDEKPR